jgi:GSCFA family protein
VKSSGSTREETVTDRDIRASSSSASSESQSLYVATSAEVDNNWVTNCANRWYKPGLDADEAGGDYAFQRLRRTWFSPRVVPKFKLHRADKFYAIGSCFARGIENALAERRIVVESAAAEFADLQPVNKDVTGLGFTNKYNTFSILNELRWALDPEAVFPMESIVQATESTWFDPHTTPTLELAGFEETLNRRELMHKVAKRVAHCRALIMTLGLVEVWRDCETDVYLNSTPVRPILKAHPDRYEFHLTSFAQNLVNLEAIHALLTRHGHPDFRVVVTVSPVPLMATLSKMDVVVANTYAKSLLRTVAQEWAAAHANVDYFPSYEIVQNSDRAATWEPDLRHVKGRGAQHIMELFVDNYLE